MKPIIERVMTISTAHITQKTDELLQDDPCEWGISVYDKGEYGYWIFIPDNYLINTPDGVKETCHGIPDDLHDCILLAMEHNCRWLCLDCDGVVVDDLKTYEWEW